MEPRARAAHGSLRPAARRQEGRPAGIGASPARPEESRHDQSVPRFPRGRAVNASAIATALGARAEEVCRRYLPHGRKSGRYWTAGDIHGARGRSLFVRLAPPRRPRQVDRRQHRGTRRPPRSHPHRLRHGLASGCPRRGARLPLFARDTVRWPTRRITIARKRRAASGSAAVPSTARMPRPISGHAVFNAAASRRCASTPRLLYRDGGGVRRLPALVAAVSSPPAPRSTPSGPVTCGVRSHTPPISAGEPPSTLCDEDAATAAFKSSAFAPLTLVIVPPLKRQGSLDDTESVAVAVRRLHGVGEHQPVRARTPGVACRPKRPDGVHRQVDPDRRPAAGRVDQHRVPEGHSDLDRLVLPVGVVGLRDRDDRHVRHRQREDREGRRRGRDTLRGRAGAGDCRSGRPA